MPINECSEGNRDQEKFIYKIPNNYRGVLLLYKKNGNTLWYEETTKYMTTFKNLGVLEFYEPKTKCENKDSC